MDAFRKEHSLSVPSSLKCSQRWSDGVFKENF